MKKCEMFYQFNTHVSFSQVFCQSQNDDFIAWCLITIVDLFTGMKKKREGLAIGIENDIYDEK